MRGLQWHTVLIYWDNLIIVQRTFNEHLERLGEVLQRLREHGLKLTQKKCHLAAREVEFVGHILSRGGIQINPRLVAANAQKEPPRSLHELQAFLGLCNYYRRFVPLFSQVIHPLKELMKKGVLFAALKRKLTEAPVLAIPQNEGMFTLDTDASQHTVWAVLFQDQDGEEKVIPYGSAAMTAAQTRYYVTR